MSNLTRVPPQSSFQSILNLTSPSSGLTDVLQVVQDGLGNNSPLSISTLALDINTSMGNFSINLDPLYATPTQINDVCVNASFLDFTSSLNLPVGTTAQRPLFPENGTIRYNTTIGQGEIYAGNAWFSLSGGSGNAYAPGAPTYIKDTFSIAKFNVSMGTPPAVFGTGSNITVLGDSTLQSNSTGSDLTGIGYGALNANYSGVSIVAVGTNALSSNMIGSYSTAVGAESNSVSNASNNNTFGFQTLNINADGSYNSVFGTGAMALSVHSNYCSAFGEQALGASTQDENSAFGYQAALFLTAGVQNVFCGALTGSDANIVLNSCTFLGYAAGASASGLFNATAIGAKSVVSQDNTVILGTTEFQTNVGIGTSTPSNILHVIGSVQFKGITTGYTGSGVVRTQNGISTTGAGTNTLNFPVDVTEDNQMVSKITISVMDSLGVHCAYATSVAAAFWNGATTASSGTLPTITFTGTGSFAVAAAWSISGNNLVLTVTGVAGSNAIWVISSEVFSSRSTTA